MLAFSVTLFVVLGVHVAISGEARDVGVFWHSTCDYPAGSGSFYVLLHLPLLAAVVGYIMGFMFPTFDPANPGSAAANFRIIFLLTRPVSRAASFLAPMAVALLAIAAFPAIAFAMLLGWLHLVHAPSLGLLLAVVQQHPAVAALGPHPGLGSVLLALDMPRRYLAATVLGLGVYVVMASQRWVVLSPNRYVKVLAIAPAFIGFFPMWNLLGPKYGQALLMMAGRHSALAWLPSTTNIAAHIAFAVAIVIGCLRIQRTADI